MRHLVLTFALLLLPLSASAADKPASVDPTRDHIRGKAEARISLIEYADFQCSFCARHHPVMLRLLRRYRKDVNWVFRHYPLPAHPLARTAAHAAECAADQKGDAVFWRITDMLFRAKNFSAETFARRQGMDSAAFTSCITDETFRLRVQEDIEDGINAGVTGTPTTFIWDHQTDDIYSIEGAYPMNVFQEIIDGILDGTGSPE